MQDLLKTAISLEKISLLKFGKHIKNNISNEHELSDLNEFLDSTEIGNDFLNFLYLYLHKNFNLWRND